MSAIEHLGEEVAAVLGATADSLPRVLDWADLVENKLAHSGLLFFPVRDAELPDCEGATDPSGTGPIRILIRKEVYDDLGASGRRANRPRATVVHELAHAVLHVPYIREMRRLHRSADVLPRVMRGAIPAYIDPEWQAWALAGSILAPRRTVAPMISAGSTAQEIADAHGVSEQFLLSHTRRMKLVIPKSSNGSGLICWEAVTSK
jgi:hypothetical protein